MTNYKHKEMGSEMIKEFIKDYPKYRDQELKEKYDIGDMQMEDVVRTFRLKKRFELSNNYGLSSGMLDRFKVMYPVNPNLKLGLEFDISANSVRSLGIKLNLSKAFDSKEKERQKLAKREAKTKRCSRCLSRKLKVNFYKNTASKDKLSSVCKQCVKLQDEPVDAVGIRAPKVDPPEWWVIANEKLKANG